MLFLSKMVLLLIDSAPEEKVSCLKTMFFYLFTLSYELLQMALPETVSRIFFDLKMCSHFIVAAVDSSLFKKQQKNWFSPQSTQKCGVSSCHSASTQLMGLSHGVMCSSHFCVQHWLPRCWQQRKSHSSEAEHGIFLLCPEWTGDSSGSCAQSWLCGQWAAPAKLTVAPSTACPPQAQPWLQVPSWHSWHISASQERAVQEQSCGKGCHGWQCLGCCHTKPPGMALSPQEPGAGFTDQISLEFFKTFILGQSLPWTFIWLSWSSHQDKAWANNPCAQTQHKSEAGLGWFCLCQLRGQLCFSAPLPFPFPTLTLASLSGAVKSQFFPGLVVLWDLYLGSAAEM